MITRFIAVLLLVIVSVLTSPVLAQDVQLGINPIVHIAPSDWDFGPIPLPADFFGPGSDPFDGGVPAENAPVGTWPGCPGDLGESNALIERKNVAFLPGTPSSDVIDVEIVALSLVSAAPITVTYGGLNPEQWDVEITLSLTHPTNGTMTIRKEHPNGGTFDSEFLLQPYFTFTRVSDSTVRTLDGGGTYEDLISTLDVPWVYSTPELACPPCATNFVPGHDGVAKVPFVFAGTLSLHTVLNGCVLMPIPTLSQVGLALVLLLLLTAGAFVLAKRRRTAARA